MIFMKAGWSNRGLTSSIRISAFQPHLCDCINWGHGISSRFCTKSSFLRHSIPDIVSLHTCIVYGFSAVYCVCWLITQHDSDLGRKYNGYGVHRPNQRSLYSAVPPGAHVFSKPPIRQLNYEHPAASALACTTSSLPTSCVFNIGLLYSLASSQPPQAPGSTLVHVRLTRIQRMVPHPRCRNVIWICYRIIWFLQHRRVRLGTHTRHS